MRLSLVLLLVSIPVSAAQFSSHGAGDLTGTITFSATIEPTSQLTIEDHYLGSGVTAYVATYHEYNSTACEVGRVACQPNGKGEVTEMLALKGDGVEFDAGNGSMVARRYRRDGWPKTISVALLNKIKR